MVDTFVLEVILDCKNQNQGCNLLIEFEFHNHYCYPDQNCDQMKNVSMSIPTLHDSYHLMYALIQLCDCIQLDLKEKKNDGKILVSRLRQI